jgi:hypothetical protein
MREKRARRRFKSVWRAVRIWVQSISPQPTEIMGLFSSQIISQNNIITLHFLSTKPLQRDHYCIIGIELEVVVV